MKYLSILVVSVLLFSCGGKDSPNKEKVSIKKVTNKIEVIDFHATHRCVTCIDIENNTLYTLHTYFKKEMAKHKLTYRVINVDEKKNYQIAEKFQAMGTALFLNIIANGKETHIDLTDFAFLKGSDKDVFVKGLKSKLEAALKKI